MTTYTATLDNGKKFKATKKGNRYYYFSVKAGRNIPVAKNKITINE
jgi:hypothetical protein